MRPDILTFTGKYFNFLEPDTASIDIEAIAHGLSNICRFGGQAREFYSVAQHSVMVAECPCVPRSLRFEALMHDAAEAFVGDMPSPLKRLLPEYKVIERRVEHAIRKRFRLDDTDWHCVNQADLVMLATEQRDLMPWHDDEWAMLSGVTPLERTVVPLSPQMAKAAFLHAFRLYAPPRVIADAGAALS